MGDGQEWRALESAGEVLLRIQKLQVSLGNTDLLDLGWDLASLLLTRTLVGSDGNRPPG